MKKNYSFKHTPSTARSSFNSKKNELFAFISKTGSIGDLIY